ncbi:glycoside hydrolase family 75 protein [Streptomyces peucetius]|uniref:Glycoside hydrolase family 75 protein n=1 Tax=Streptomyces peucetius TaxID=1950 RepID=A0ABY6IEI5_STRPE|nr:glycoside hydrolase family 75 protein [Streptomyces peucetius]UYQ65413.1 glycoside hydrolase family 75 protein [Streptomyces peucetius]
MRIRHTALALAAGFVVLSAATMPAAAQPGTIPPPPPPAPGSYRAAPEADVDAAALLAALGRCTTQISKGGYATDRGRAANIPVCERREAVYWTADMDIDCDGRRTARCNRDTDPSYQPATAFTQSDGRYLNAEKLPFVVVPAPSGIWDYRSSGIRGGSAAVMIHDGKVVYGVVGDTGPSGIIGEASYGAAQALGIDPDPATGGVPSGVTYIVFKDSKVSPIESHPSAAALGEELARRFLAGAEETGAAAR